MGAEMTRQGQVGASAQVLHPDETYDVELHRMLNEANLWIEALKGPTARLVEEAETNQRDSNVEAIKLAQTKVQEALQRLINAAYEREITR
jgi:hypothetical protein